MGIRIVADPTNHQTRVFLDNASALHFKTDDSKLFTKSIPCRCRDLKLVARCYIAVVNPWSADLSSSSRAFNNTYIWNIASIHILFIFMDPYSYVFFTNEYT